MCTKQKAKKLKWTYALLLLIAAVACKEDEKVDPSSPSYLIAESEKLEIPPEVDLPGNSPHGYKRVATYYAEGVQMYKARQKEGSDPAIFEWVFVAPKADLYDNTNKKTGTHYAGPLWKLSSSEKDSINAQQFTPARTASTDANSIPWLQLMPKTGTTPTGIFKDVAYIQRIATIGGKAPATPPASAAETIDVPYTAVYRFTKINQ